MSNDLAWAHNDALKTFPFLSSLVNNWEEIKEEYLSVSRHTMRWPETTLHNQKWDAYGLLFKGEWLPTSKNCPKTTALIQNIPNVYIGGFSVMRAGCVIYPHMGYTNEVLRSHLGLICPTGAYLMVNDQKLMWGPGRLFVFDDTAKHSAANPTTEDRVILIVDFYRDP